MQHKIFVRGSSERKVDSNMFVQAH